MSFYRIPAMGKENVNSRTNYKASIRVSEMVMVGG
jgi:hypothetical protein